MFCISFQLICYLNFGYPTIEEGIQAASEYISCGCTAIQLDIPSRDPYLEHQNIKDRMAQCLVTTPDYESYFDGICRIRKMYPDIEIVFMLYENIVEELGAERIIRFFREAGIKRTTYVGSMGPIYRTLIEAGIDIACYVQFHLPEDEVRFALASGGTVLYQMRSAGQTRPGCERFEDGLAYLRGRGLQSPIYASVGIRTPEDVRYVKQAGADGVFVGSALMRVVDNRKLLGETLHAFIEAAGEGSKS